jgi:hypothetical protein
MKSVQIFVFFLVPMYSSSLTFSSDTNLISMVRVFLL